MVVTIVTCIPHSHDKKLMDDWQLIHLHGNLATQDLLNAAEIVGNVLDHSHKFWAEEQKDETQPGK